MLLTAELKIKTDAPKPSACVLMLQPQSGVAQAILKNDLTTSAPVTFHEYPDTYGNICLRAVSPSGPFQLQSRIVAKCADTIDVEPAAPFIPMDELPDGVLTYTLPSRYCESDLLDDKAKEITGAEAPGYPQVEAIRRWIHDHFTYAYGTTNSSTSARDVIATATGVCRDYTHVGIALCRSLNIPARMVAGYLYQLDPMDMHAWFEAFIGGRWYTFDATQSEPRGNRIVVAYGRDAADVAIATHFTDIGNMQLQLMIQAE